MRQGNKYCFDLILLHHVCYFLNLQIVPDATHIFVVISLSISMWISLYERPGIHSHHVYAGIVDSDTLIFQILYANEFYEDHAMKEAKSYIRKI